MLMSTPLINGICDKGHLLDFDQNSKMSEPPTAQQAIDRVYRTLLPHQKDFCDDIENRKLALVCGFGAGKTYSLIAKSVILAAKNVGFVSALFEPTSVMIRDVLHRSMLDMLEEWQLPFTYRASPMPELTINFAEGSHTILFRTILNYQRLRGQNLCAIGFDEADTIPCHDAEQAMNMALARLRSGNVQQFFVTTTPEGFGFAYKTFKKDAKSDTRLIQASTLENPHLPKDFVDNLYLNYDKSLIESYIRGQFVNLNSGAVYTRFDRAKHVKDDFDKELYKEPLKIGIDFNVMNMSAVIGVTVGDKLFIIDEITKEDDTDSLARAIKKRYPNNRIYVYPDASGQSRNTTNASRTDISILEGYGFTSMALRSNPPIKDRVQTVQACLENSKGRVRMEVHQRCGSLIESLELQSYDEKTGMPSKNEGYDHLPDALGYLVYREFNLIHARAGGKTGIRIY